MLYRWLSGSPAIPSLRDAVSLAPWRACPLAVRPRVVARVQVEELGRSSRRRRAIVRRSPSPGGRSPRSARRGCRRQRGSAARPSSTTIPFPDDDVELGHRDLQRRDGSALHFGEWKRFAPSATRRLWRPGIARVPRGTSVGLRFEPARRVRGCSRERRAPARSARRPDLRKLGHAAISTKSLTVRAEGTMTASIAGVQRIVL